MLASSDSDSENADSQSGIFLDSLLLAQVSTTICLLNRNKMEHVLSIRGCTLLSGI